jgi:ADP-ribose pyrophosphatase YjhB (NUDIX family)
MDPHRIRIAICIVRNKDRILVEHGFDPVKVQHFYRPPGGAIEFGERAVDAVTREFKEELDADLGDLYLRGVLENLFEFDGATGHEIVFVFEGRFLDDHLNDMAELTIREPPSAGLATWITLDEVAAGSRPLYPDGLVELLAESQRDHAEPERDLGREPAPRFSLHGERTELRPPRPAEKADRLKAGRDPELVNVPPSSSMRQTSFPPTKTWT